MLTDLKAIDKIFLELSVSKLHEANESLLQRTELCCSALTGFQRANLDIKIKILRLLKSSINSPQKILNNVQTLNPLSPLQSDREKETIKFLSELEEMRQKKYRNGRKRVMSIFGSNAQNLKDKHNQKESQVCYPICENQRRFSLRQKENIQKQQMDKAMKILETLCHKLRVFGGEQGKLQEQGVINLYIQIYQSQKKQPHCSRTWLMSQILSYLEQLIRYFFLETQLKFFRKNREGLFKGREETLEGQDQAMERRIKERVWRKRCSQLLKEYLKSQEMNNKELCRICYKKVEIDEIAQHADYCAKKTYIKELMLENFDKRIQVVKKLNLLAAQMQLNDSPPNPLIQKISQFYQNLSKHPKKTKRLSLRYQQNNSPSLFFYQSQPKPSAPTPETKLISELEALENRCFYLSKKFEEIKGNNDGRELKWSGIITVNKGVDVQASNKNNKPLRQFCMNSSSCSTSSLGSQAEISGSEESLHELPVTEQPPPRRQKKLLTQIRPLSPQSNKSNSSQDIIYGGMSISDFLILKKLGKGAFGTVYLVKRKKTQDVYAMKVIPIDPKQGQQQLQALKNQYGVYRQIAGEHLVTATFSFTQCNTQFYVLEYMPNGDLSSILQEQIYLEQKDAKFYLAEIALAIQHLHTSQIIHRDLKPENIVFDGEGHAKLTDFGLSQIRVKDKIQKARVNSFTPTPQKNRSKSPNPNSQNSPQAPHPEKQSQKMLSISTKKKSILENRKQKIIGTPDYMAPQIVNGECLDTPAVDWWSFGVIAYEAMLGCRPFSANTVQQILDNILKGQIQWPEIGPEPQMMSPQAHSLIENLLKTNYEERLGFKGFEEIKEHEFFQGVCWEGIRGQAPPLGGRGRGEDVEGLGEDPLLREEVQRLLERQKEAPVHELPNYVRYDLLTAETLCSLKTGSLKRQKRISKLKTIAADLQSLEPDLCLETVRSDKYICQNFE